MSERLPPEYWAKDPHFCDSPGCDGVLVRDDPDGDAVCTRDGEHPELEAHEAYITTRMHEEDAWPAAPV